MNLYNLLFGLLLSIVSFWLFVREMTKSKKPIDGYKIRIIGGLFGLFLLGLYVLFSEVTKL
jgi:hydrogenase-4 membrane subunit HyfE